jgi:hypothetical protein
VSSEQSELAGHGGRTTFLFFRAGLGFGKQGAKVSVAKTVDLNLAAIDCEQQGAVLGRPGIECSDPVVVSLDGFTNCVNPLKQGHFSGGGRECGEVAGVGSPRNLGSSFEINHAFAQNAPGLLTGTLGAAMRAGLCLAKNAKVPGLVDGRFDAQDTALFVVHLDRVGIEGVFDSNAFGTLFQIADDFSVKITAHFSVCGHSMAQKTHDVCTGKAGDGVADQAHDLRRLDVVMPVRYAADMERTCRIDKCTDSFGPNSLLVPVAGLEPARLFTVPGF